MKLRKRKKNECDYLKISKTGPKWLFLATLGLILGQKLYSKGCGSSERVIFQVCWVDIAKSNTAHLKKCPNKNKI